MKKILGCLLVSIFTLHTHAQVTIGSGIPPVSGALLDLKEQDKKDGTANSTKGLGLPRVELSNLKPQNNTELAESIGNITDSYDIDEHIGLVIYNVKETERCTFTDPIYKGVYVWDGEQWQLIGEGTESLATGVYRVTDLRDGEEYLARNFGDAGDWMLENMRYIDADFVAGSGNSFLPLQMYYTYPNADLSNPAIAPSTWHKKQGLIYDFFAATKNLVHVAPFPHQGQIAGSVPGSDEVESDTTKNGPNSKGYYFIRGLCPNGWHLPSDREWNDLEREIYNNPEKYSTYSGVSEFSPNNWQSTWEYSSSTINGESITRGSGAVAKGHGLAMLSTCEPAGSIGGVTGGRSLSAAQGGFDVLPAGFILSPSRGIEFYGTRALFWSSSVAWSQDSWDRVLYIYSPAFGESSGMVTRNSSFGSKSSLKSVRCKKD